jgi:hypothetical protein
MGQLNALAFLAPGMFPVYGGKYLPRKAVHNFQERTKVAYYAQPGLPVLITTGADMQLVEKFGTSTHW